MYTHKPHIYIYMCVCMYVWCKYIYIFICACVRALCDHLAICITATRWKHAVVCQSVSKFGMFTYVCFP